WVWPDGVGLVSAHSAPLNHSGGLGRRNVRGASARCRCRVDTPRRAPALLLALRRAGRHRYGAWTVPRLAAVAYRFRDRGISRSGLFHAQPDSDADHAAASARRDEPWLSRAWP